MDAFTKIFRVVPLPDTDDEQLEAFFAKQILPAVDMEPTRGGQIAETSFHRDTSAEREDRYVWMVSYGGFKADWVDHNLEDAMKELKSVAMPISSTVLIRLS